jgi:hypothetical protein
VVADSAYAGGELKKLPPVAVLEPFAGAAR